MRLLLASHDLVGKTCHLMPWRTLCEVTRHLRNDGHTITLVSLGTQNGALESDLLPADSLEVRKDIAYMGNDIATLVQRFKPDVIYWPVTWRESPRRTKAVGRLGIPIIGYFPGGCYSLRASMYAMARLGLRATMPYLVEAISPKSLQLSYLRVNGFRSLIAMTEATAKCVVKAGWPEQHVYAIPPGKDEPAEMNYNVIPVAPICDWLKGRPYYLFVGPPSRIRGIYELLDAYDAAAELHPDVCLICLFRSDGLLDTHDIRDKLEKMKHRQRIYIEWKSLEKDALNSFIAGSHAVVLPFVLVPSEIPLAIIEAMAWGKPIITTKSGGTGAFVEPFGKAVEVGRVDELTHAMMSLLEDSALYKEKCLAVAAAYQTQPTWREISQAWLKVAESLRGYC